MRGAIRVAANEKQAIYAAAVKLAGEMVARNGVAIDRIISIVCSLTDDLTVANPATGLRLDRFGCSASRRPPWPGRWRGSYAC